MRTVVNELSYAVCCIWALGEMNAHHVFCHIVLEDHNLDDHSVEACLDRAMQYPNGSNRWCRNGITVLDHEVVEASVRTLVALLRLTFAERESVMHLAESASHADVGYRCGMFDPSMDAQMEEFLDTGIWRYGLKESYVDERLAQSSRRLTA